MSTSEILTAIAITVTILIFLGTVANGWNSFLISRVLKGIDETQAEVRKDLRRLFENDEKLNTRLSHLEGEHKAFHEKAAH